MKKLIALLLAACLIAGLTACKNASRESLLKNAEDVELTAFIAEIVDNPRTAEVKYENKTCKFTGYIGDIFIAEPADQGNMYIADYAELKCFPGDDASELEEILGDELENLHAADHIRVYLNDDDLNRVKTGDKVTVVGMINTVTLKDTRLVNAYIVE